MSPQKPFSVDEAQMIREEFLAPAYRRLEAMSEEFPEHGQQLTFAKNHIRLAFMELGFGIALTNGLDPLANKVSKAQLVNLAEPIQSDILERVHKRLGECVKILHGGKDEEAREPYFHQGQWHPPKVKQYFNWLHPER